MSLLLSDEELNYRRYECKREVLFDNIDRLLDSVEMLTYAVEHPNDRGLWYLACNDILPESDELFPELLRKHFGDISLSMFCVYEAENETGNRFEKFENDCLVHFRQLKKDQIFSMQKKLLYTLEALKYDLTI